MILQLGGTTNSSGAKVWIDESGNVSFGAATGGIAGSAQSLSNNSAITVVNLRTARATNTGNVTGITLNAGIEGQELTVTNEGSGSITFNATTATSHLSVSTCTIAAAVAAHFKYAGGKWYPVRIA